MTTMRQRKRRLSWHSLSGQVTEPTDEAMRVMARHFATSPQYTVEAVSGAVNRAKTKSILDMAGIIKPPDGTHVSIEDMNPWR